MADVSRDGLVALLEDAGHMIEQMAQYFTAPNFTDRYGDGPRLVAMRKRISAALAQAQAEPERRLEYECKAEMKFSVVVDGERAHTFGPGMYRLYRADWTARKETP